MLIGPKRPSALLQMFGGCPEEDDGQLSHGPALDFRGPGPCHVICLSKLRITGVCILLKGRVDISLDFY